MKRQLLILACGYAIWDVAPLERDPFYVLVFRPGYIRQLALRPTCSTRVEAAMTKCNQEWRKT